MSDRKTKKAEEILKMIKAYGKRLAKIYDGPPDPDFIIQQLTSGTGRKAAEYELNQSSLDEVGLWTGTG